MAKLSPKKSWSLNFPCVVSTSRFGIVSPRPIFFLENVGKYWVLSWISEMEVEKCCLKIAGKCCMKGM